MPPQLTVIVPTRDRRSVLLRTLSALRTEAADVALEVVVVDDGSTDGTAEVVGELSDRGSGELKLIVQPARGPATARNRGLEAARAPVCMFLGDDVRAGPGLIRRHAEFHRRRPDRTAALLGRVVPAPPMRDSRFARWLHEEGVQFDFRALEPGRAVPGRLFYTANASAKTDLLLDVGGFDEDFTEPACEDVDLGLRLERAGLELSYDPDAVAEHYHPTDLHRTLRRIRTVGRASARLAAKEPALGRPKRPGLRHEVGAATLAALNAPGVRRLGPLRRFTWRFLCAQAYREAFWGESVEPDPPVRIGGRLLRIAARDPDLRLASGE